MLKKFLFGTIALAAAFTINSTANAAEVNQTIQITSATYPNINFYPRTIHVNQGDTLHLTVKNTVRGYSRIYMPDFNLDQEIPKGGVAKIDLCIANPLDKTMWFNISSIDAKQIPGYIITEDYKTPIATVASRVIDTTALNDIINYNKQFCYDEKSEPKYTGGASPVRGYW